VVISYSRAREILKTKYYKQFLKYMEGQTVVEGGVFDDDFLRWVKGMRVID
jgi:hypothetical protein